MKEAESVSVETRRYLEPSASDRTGKSLARRKGQCEMKL